MKRYVAICIIVTLFGASIVPMYNAHAALSTEYDVLYVDDDFNESTPGYGIYRFSSIQDAVYAAHEGALIFVYKGIYNESIDVDKELVLVGENKHATIISPPRGLYGIRVTGENVEIMGFFIKGRKEVAMGIFIDNAIRTDIRNCIITDFADTGIYVSGGKSDLITINKCRIEGNVKGIHAVEGNIDMISYCNISNNDDEGLRMEDATVCTIERNVIYNNTGWAIFIRTRAGRGSTGMFFIHHNHVEGNRKGVLEVPNGNLYLMGMYVKENNFINNGGNNEISIYVEYPSKQSLFLFPIVYFEGNYWKNGSRVYINCWEVPLVNFFIQHIICSLFKVWCPYHDATNPHETPPVDP